jgi:hypothetical protein
MEQQTVEVTFQGEEAWLETGGGKGLQAQQVGTFFPELAARLED